MLNKNTKKKTKKLLFYFFGDNFFYECDVGFLKLIHKLTTNWSSVNNNNSIKILFFSLSLTYF